MTFPRSLIIAFVAVGLTGCTGFRDGYRHGYTTEKYAGRCLAVKGPDGSARLQIEADYDPIFRTYVGINGDPDYLYVRDRLNVTLYYLAKDEAIAFSRGFSPNSTFVRHRPIPSELARLLPRPGQQALAKTRSKAQPQTARAKPAPRETKPASRPRTASARLDIDGIRSSLSSRFEGIAGVTGWRHAPLANGTTRWLAQAGTILYEILPDKVTVMAGIAADDQTTAMNALLAFARVNQAVFDPASTRTANAQLPALAKQVAADATGEKKFRRRISRHSIEMSRIPEFGFVVYTVHAR